MELKGLKTEFLGKNLIYCNSIDSTQKKIKNLKRPENGTLIITDNQYEGVGTHDRKWYTGNGKNIAMSFVILPSCNIKKIESLTIQIAKCLVISIKKKCNVELDIKEPNDLYFKGKKVGGILTETSCKGEIVNKIFVGIGINVNQDEFPGNLEEIATSLKKICQKEFVREKIIVQFLNDFEKKYLKIIN